MDLSNSGQTFTSGYSSSLQNLQDQDDAIRNSINARQQRALAAGQQNPTETQQVAASGDVTAPIAPATTPAPSPDTTAAPQTPASPPVAGRPTAASATSPVNGVSEQPADAQGNNRVMASNPNGPWAGRTAQTPYDERTSQIAAEEARLTALRQQAQTPQFTGDLDPIYPLQNQVDASEAKLRALRQQQTAVTNPSSIGPMASTPAPTAKPPAAPAASTPDSLGSMTYDPHQDAANDVAAIQRELSRMAPDDKRRTILNSELVKAQARVQSTPSMGQSAQAATLPAPQAPAQQTPQQGPTFYGPSGSPFTTPAQYSDGQIAALRNNAAMAQNAAQLAWMQYQQNPSPQTMQAVQAANQQVQQLHQGLYDADIYAKTQAAQGGNPQAFSALVQEYSSKVGQPIQLVPGNNGMYQAVAQGGQVIAQGSPAQIAGTLGGVLNSQARALAMHLATVEAEAGAKARGEENAKLPAVMAKLETDMRMKLSENDTTLLKQALENNKPTTVQLTGGQVVYVDPSNKASPLSIYNVNSPTKTGGVPVQQPLRQP